MTIIILQIMRYGLYSSVDTTLQNAANNASDYVTRTMERSDSIQSDNTINESGKNKSSSNDGLSNVSVLCMIATVK